MIPHINLPGVIGSVIGFLYDQADTSLNFIGAQMESLYSAIRGWLWKPLRWAINETLGGLDDLIDAIAGLPADIDWLISQVERLAIEGIGLTGEILKEVFLETILDWLEELWAIVEGWIDEHWEDL